MLLGVMAGCSLGSGADAKQKSRGLGAAGALLLVAGIALDPGILPGVESMMLTVCPIIKRIWTPSYVLYSGGWAMLFAALFYWLIDVCNLRRWTLPFVVVGMNSLVMYLLAAFGTKRIQPWLGSIADRVGISSPFLPIIESLVILSLFWLVCFWMYRRRLFVRI
jgi:predicted acyltransferase